MKKNKKLVAVTMGDPSGISTEIIIKSWKRAAYTFFVIHDPEYISKVASELKLKVNIKLISNSSWLASKLRASV